MTAATQLVTALGPDTPDDGEPGRQQRGLAIAALVPIQEHKHGYRVPSQSGRGDYIVSIDEDGRFCTCPDYALRQKDCKHLLAVQFRALRESAASGAVAAEIKAITAATATSRPKAQPISTVNMGIEIEDDGDATGPVASSVPEEEAVVEENKGKKKRPTYQRDWRKYDASKEYEEENFEVLLADIASLVRQPAYEFGRPQLLLSDVVYSLVRKAYGGQSRRIVMSSLRRAEEKRLITKAPSQGSISKYLERVALTPILKHLIQQSTLPLWGLDNGVYATDATGFRTSVYNRWFEHKWEEGQESKEVKERKKRQWIKAHCVFGTTTKVVTAVEVSNGTEADTNYLQDLTKATLSEHEVIDMCVDLGYLDNDHYEFMDSLNINLWMPFKVNSKESSPNRRPDGPWERAYHFFHLHREEFLKRYHPRSISETGFFMVKGRFGESVRGRTRVAQFNEVLCKVLAHNICCLITAMYEFDLDLSFGNSDSRLKLPSAYYRDGKSNGLSIYGTPKPEPQSGAGLDLDPPGGPILVT